MLKRPRWLLHLEGTAILIMALYFYHSGQYHWWLFAALFFAPDLSMIGYLRNAKWGSATYNLIHTLTGPLVLLGGGLALAAPQCIPYALIWLAHIGFDRALGYGLKYPTFFKDTHLQHV
ncbi:MAG: DUF4260 domain-containing protein [Candidatus Acidiferrum sp.]